MILINCEIFVLWPEEKTFIKTIIKRIQQIGHFCKLTKPKNQLQIVLIQPKIPPNMHHRHQIPSNDQSFENFPGDLVVVLVCVPVDPVGALKKINHSVQKVE